MTVVHPNGMLSFETSVATIQKGQRVALGAGGLLEPATFADQIEAGVAQNSNADGEPVTIATPGAAGTVFALAQGTVAVGDLVYAAGTDEATAGRFTADPLSGGHLAGVAYSAASSGETFALKYVPVIPRGRATVTLSATVRVGDRVTAAGAVAGLTERGLGYALRAGVSGDVIPVRVAGGADPFVARAAKAIAIGDVVSTAAAGETTDAGTANGFEEGIALTAAAAADDALLVQPRFGDTAL